MYYNAIVLGRECVVECLCRKNGRVGNSDDVVLQRTDACSQGILLNNLSLVVLETDEVADAERSHVGHDDT